MFQEGPPELPLLMLTAAEHASKPSEVTLRTDSFNFDNTASAPSGRLNSLVFDSDFTTKFCEESLVA
jgi:hypothetical protein